MHTDNLYTDGGIIDICSSDGILHTSPTSTKKPKKNRLMYERIIDGEDASICLSCTRKECHGTKACYDIERKRQTGKADDGVALFLAFEPEYHRLKKNGVSDRKIASELGIPAGTFCVEKNNKRFCKKSMEKVKIYLNERGIEYGK